MKNNNKGSKKIIIIVSIIAILIILILLFVFKDEKQNLSIYCEGIESNEESELITEISINKKGGKTYWNYVGKIKFFDNDEFAYNFISLFVEEQVSKLQKIDKSIATISKSHNEITYEFNFSMDLLKEDEMKELFGIYSNDLAEIKKYFENGGLKCEEI